MGEQQAWLNLTREAIQPISQLRLGFKGLQPRAFLSRDGAPLRTLLLTLGVNGGVSLGRGRGKASPLPISREWIFHS